MSDNQNNNKPKTILTSYSGQYNVSKLIQKNWDMCYSVHFVPKKKNMLPKFQPEKTKPSKIILTSDKPSKK